MNNIINKIKQYMSEETKITDVVVTDTVVTEPTLIVTDTVIEPVEVFATCLECSGTGRGKLDGLKETTCGLCNGSGIIS